MSESDWIEVIDPHAGSFFYNKISKESSWVLPISELEKHFQFGWEEKPNNEGFYNSSSSDDESNDTIEVGNINQNDYSGQKSSVQSSLLNEFRFSDSSMYQLGRHGSLSSHTEGRNSTNTDIDNQCDNQSELLHNFDTITEHASINSELAGNCVAEFQCWLSNSHSEVFEFLDFKLKYPEYLDFSYTSLVPTSSISKSISNFSIIIRPTSLTVPITQTKIACNCDDLVKDVIRRALRRYKLVLGIQAFGQDENLYLLKVTGLNEYFVHLESKITAYSYITSSLRSKNEIDLSLVCLCQNDSKTRMQYLQEEESYIRDIQFRMNYYYEQDIFRELNKNCQENSDSILIKDTHYPFRIAILGVEKLPQDIIYDEVIVVVTLRLGNRKLLPATEISFNSDAHEPCTLETNATNFARNPRWPKEWLSSSLVDVSSLHISTLLCCFLFGKYKNSYERYPISMIQKPLIDYNGNLMSGNQSLKLWPHKHTSFQYSDYMFSCLDIPDGFPRIENHDTSGGTLFIELSSHHMPVKANAYYTMPQKDINYSSSTISSFGSISFDNTTYSDETASSTHSDSSKLLSIHTLPREKYACERNSTTTSTASYNSVFSKQDEVLAKSAVLAKGISPAAAKITDKEKKNLNIISKYDHLQKLSRKEKILIWKARNYCKKFSKLLPKFLLCINWSSPESTNEAREYLANWQGFSLKEDALILLDGQFPDPVVRCWAVNIINKMQDSQLSEYLLQLVQALKHENHHYCSLSQMLLYRGLNNPAVLGHRLFWLLRTEASVRENAERYNTLIAIYCSISKSHRDILYCQNALLSQLEIIALLVKQANKSEALMVARKELTRLNQRLPTEFFICLSPKYKCKSIIVDECKVMSSAKMPIWLSFENADPRGSPIHSIFKYGDDLRQDLMTLQMINLMDRIWRDESLDLRMKVYGCQSSGLEIGMIEVVPNSKTTAQIHCDYGGLCFGALMETPIDSFLRNHTQDSLSNYENAVDNFIRTCAGYCVATYVLGIGDRHSDNIMVTKSGHLFHIDFGHFLGNFKSKFGVSRERAPFVLTPEMAFVMGNRDGPRFSAFIELCCNAYNILRRNGNLFISLFSLMLPAYVPELTCAEDILYLRDQLSLDISEATATKKFKGEIKNALSSTSRRVDNWIHNIKHGISSLKN